MFRKQLYFLALFQYILFGFFNSYAQWNKVAPFEPYQIEIFNLSVKDNYVLVNSWPMGISVSADNGFTWNILKDYPFESITVRGNDIFGGILSLYKSTDFGKTWSILNSFDSFISSIAIKDSNIYVGTFYSGLWTSNDNGKSFVRDTNNIYKTNNVNTILIDDTTVLAGTSSSGIYLSTNNGKSWKQSNNGLTNLDIHALISSFGNILAGTDNGVFLSSDNGTDWVQVNNGLTDSSVYSFASVANYVFCGTNNGGIFATTNYGQKWTSIADSLTTYNISALALSGNNILAGSSNGSLWYRTVANMFTTGVNDKQNNKPDKFSLYQNYPNPFNPSTIISYDLPKAGFVTLKVYDILGREAETLVNEFQTAGEHSVQFSADKLQTTNHKQFSSGVYFYQLTAGDYTSFKKMVLLK